MSDPWWTSPGGAPLGGHHGIGRVEHVSQMPFSNILRIDAWSWMPAAWESLEGARLATAARPELWVTITSVDLTRREVEVGGDRLALNELKPGVDLYFYDPNWKPERFLETPNA